MELDPIQAYTLSDRFPVYSYTQRVRGQIQTTRAPGPQTGVNFFPIDSAIRRPASTITFNAPQVSQNLFLCSDAYIKVKLRTRRYKVDDGTDIASIDDGNMFLDRCPVKPGMVLANAMRTAQVRLNQHGISYNDLRYVQKNLNVQSFGKEFIETRLSTSGAKFWENEGQLTFSGECANNNSSQFITIGVLEYSSNLGVDNGYSASCDRWNEFPPDSSGDPSTTATRIIEITEPLGIGPFKPRNQDGFGNSVYHGLSDLIPYVQQVGLKLTLDNFSANLVEPYFCNIPQLGALAPFRAVYLDDGVVEAELVLKWVRPRPELILSIPKQLYIPSFQYDHREFILNEGDPILSNTTVDFSFENIHTRQIPTQLMVWATVDKDDTDSFMASPINVWNSPISAITTQVENNDQTAFESNCAFRELTIRTNTLGGTDIWDQQFNEEEQYKYTTEACHPDFPWDNTKWNGYVLNPSTTSAPNQYLYGTKAYNFLCLDTDDLKQYNIINQKTGKLVRDQVWNFRGTLSPQDGLMDNTRYTVASYAGIAAPVIPPRISERKYKFHVAFLYNNYRINLGYDGVVSSDFLSKFY